MRKYPELLAAEIKVTYAAKRHMLKLPKITTSKEGVKAFRRIWSDEMEYREESYLILLNRCNRMMGWFRLSVGGLSGT